MTSAKNTLDKYYISLVGYHGRDNLGDDIFRDVVIRQLSKNKIETVCYVLSANTEGFEPYEVNSTQVLAVTNPIKSISRFKWLQLLVYGAKSNLIIFAAGSIFTTQAFGLMKWVLWSLKKLKSKSFRCVALGVSVGPFPNQIKMKQCDELLKQFDMVLLRDRASENRIKDSMSFGNYRASYDLGLLAIHHKKPENQKPISNVLAFSLTPRAFPDASSSAELTLLTKATKYFLDEDSTLRILAFSACSDEADGDDDLTKHFMHQLSEYSNRITYYSHSDIELEKSIALIANCKAVIASRMHVGVIAMMHAIPTLQIAYEPKVKAFYEQHSLSKTYLLNVQGYDFSDIKNFMEDVHNGKAEKNAQEQKHLLTSYAIAVQEELNEVLRSQLTDLNIS